MGYIFLAIIALLVGVILIIALFHFDIEGIPCLMVGALGIGTILFSLISLAEGLTLNSELDGTYELMRTTNNDYIEISTDGSYKVKLNEEGFPRDYTCTYSKPQIIYFEGNEKARIKITKDLWQIEYIIYIPKS